jgi:hypothetical protein
MKKIKISIGVVIFLVFAIFIRKLPIFVSYSFWSEWGPNNYSDGGYELGLMNFRDALVFTTNNLIDIANWGLLALYSFIPTFLFVYFYPNKPAK